MTMSLSKWIVVLSVLLLGSYGKGSPSVEVLNGVLKGIHEVSYGGRTFSAFRGIPYAKPPLGDLRFEPPQELSNWTGVWVADTKIRCLQVLFAAKVEIEGDEDCLYLNVYVPRENPSVSDNLDVIVDIHGGAFTMGSGTFYAGPNFLMDREVVLVTMNYRLGPLGFLSTGDDVVPGNNGLKDQSFALKWVHENIGFFGGNLDSVTITGMSAGGASVHFHYFSPLSKGYFHRGMSNSGTALNPWAVQTSSPLEVTKALAHHVGCDAEITSKLVKCLRERSAFTIIESSPKLFYHPLISHGIFKPVVEPNSPVAFLIDTPYNLLLKKQINDLPWIASFTKDEGVLPAALFEDLSFVEENWYEFLPVALDYKSRTLPQNLREVTEKITEFYLKGQPLTYDAFIKIATDGLFAVHIEKAARLQADLAKSSVYAYTLQYKGQHSFAEMYSPSKENTRVAHGDDVLYYFNTDITESKLSQSDEEMKDIFLNLITTYASKGVPEIADTKWEPVDDPKTFRHLKIRGPRNIVLERVDELTPLSFWESLPLNEHERASRLKDEL